MWWLQPKALNNAHICPRFKIIAHPHKPDKTEHTKQSVDMGMSPADNVPEAEINATYPGVDWSYLELPMECKTSSTEQDPFDEERGGEPVGEKRKDVLGQILSYAELVFQRQQRMFFFMVIFLGDYARIARFDHSGVFATHKFEYKTKNSPLVNFLYGYSRLSAVDRGHDPTATRILSTDPLYKEMKERARNVNTDDPHDYVRELFRHTLKLRRPWWKLEVHEQRKDDTGRDLEPVIHKFAVGAPYFQAPGVAGRFTRGYIALPVNDQGGISKDATFVFLKDAWRVDHPGIEQEGATLQFLNQRKVPYVPTLVCHGDLGQVTQSQKHWKELHPEVEKVPLKTHSHYRVVVKEVGLPLTEFLESSSELCYALYCCIKAHAAAFDAGIIHRDISAGNLLIYKDDEGEWTGLLNDWELSKKVDNESPEGRQPDRTGTWQYMSAHALNDPYHRIVIEDELESFFHVLLYYAIRFVPHNLGDEDVGLFLHEYFDGYLSTNAGYRCGLAKRNAMVNGVIDVSGYKSIQGGQTLRFLWPAPLAKFTPTPGPSQRSSSPAPRSSPSPAEHPSARPNSSIPSGRSPSPQFSAIYGSDLTPLNSDDSIPEEEPQDEHPINEIISELLTWFRAYYALDMEHTRTPSANSRTKKTSKGIIPSRSRVALKNDGHQDQKWARGRSLQPIAAKLKEDEALRENLKTHEAILSLFNNSFEKVWPANDKGPDKKPKGGCAPPKSAVPSDSTRTSSKRRSIDDIPGGTLLRPTKRSRI
ncbi:hypothetical protein BD311DRAFT_666476 [Dichomitus squalens]|uniref:Fungal-type protein kinase domain-containing protein n=2 Tax=Dichomitus squalens TaxID=114155 RepID=A0A4Q9ML37_9APHY|nr:hypothetical protein BD311DRAFT_666476 [Dichomitus squalens]